MNAAEFLENCRVLYDSGQGKLFRYSEFGEQKYVTYQTFFTEVKQLSAYYRVQFGTSHKVLLLSESSYQYYKHIMAIICSGNIAVPINQMYSVEHIAEFAAMTDTYLVACTGEIVEDVREGIKGCRIITMDEADVACKGWAWEEDWKRQQDDAVILMLLSSGTSGKSKVVPLSNKNMFTHPYGVYAGAVGRGRESRQEMSLLCLPFYHIAFNILILEDIGNGKLIQISDAKRLMPDLREGFYDRIIVTPSMMKRILSADMKSGIGQPIRIGEAVCVGAGMDHQLVHSMRSQGISPGVYYGLTEASGVVTGMGAYRDGSCGKAYPHCEIKIDDGEICIRGDNVMEGYYKNEEETAKVLRDGWLYTGDLGRIDEDGYLYVKGRKKNIMILSNGENVSQEELEEMLYQCAQVRECRVYAEDEKICAEVFLGGDSAPAGAEEAVKGHLEKMNKQLPMSHRIKSLCIVEEELKKNGMGKLLR